jgi:F-box protein 39
MYYLLLPSVPLAKFHMFSGHVWDQSRSRNFRSTIGLLITQYTATLGIYNRYILLLLLCLLLSEHKILIYIKKEKIILLAVEVTLQLRNNRESLDDLLICMLIRCKSLTRLQYDGIIRSLETLREICQLQAENKTRK